MAYHKKCYNQKLVNNYYFPLRMQRYVSLDGVISMVIAILPALNALLG